MCHMSTAIADKDSLQVRKVGGHTLRMRDFGDDLIPGTADDTLNISVCQSCHAGLTSFDRNGVQVGEISAERRTVISYQRIPRPLISAVVAAEDAAFAAASAALDELTDKARTLPPFAFYAHLLGALSGRKRFLELLALGDELAQVCLEPTPVLVCLQILQEALEVGFVVRDLALV